MPDHELKKPIFDPAVQSIMDDAELVAEPLVSALFGEQLGTTQQRRSRGKMPPHVKLGNQIFYERSDIVKMIREAPRVYKDPPAGRKQADDDLLGRKA